MCGSLTYTLQFSLRGGSPTSWTNPEDQGPTRHLEETAAGGWGWLQMATHPRAPAAPAWGVRSQHCTPGIMGALLHSPLPTLPGMGEGRERLQGALLPANGVWHRAALGPHLMPSLGVPFWAPSSPFTDFQGPLLPGFYSPISETSKTQQTHELLSMR